MADNVSITEGAGKTILADEVTHGTLGTGVAQLVKIMDGTIGGTDTVKVLAPSTPPAAADPALVVAVSPNGLGDIAHDAADSSSKPVKVGAKAVAGLSAETPVAANDRTNLLAGLDGAQFVRPHCGLEDIVSNFASNTDGTSTPVLAAAGAGIKQYLTSVTIANMHASTTAYVELKSGTTVMYRLPVPPGGITQNFPVPLRPNAANEAWNFHPSAAVTTLHCSMVGFKSKV